MDLKDILSVSGHPGLFRKITQGKNGVIVESVEDGKRMPVYASTKVSALEDIAIFTTGDDVPLSQVLKNIFVRENGKASIDHKSENDVLKQYFAEVLPEFDRERVYVSDIRKVVLWYNILQKTGLVKFDEDVKDAVETSNSTDETEQTPVTPAD